MKDVSPFKKLMLPLFVALFISVASFGQVLNQPVPAPNPNIGATSPWTSACGSASFNEFFVNFTWNPPLVGGANEFILELSDATGNFDAPTELDSASDKNTDFDFEFSFALATDIQGDGYRFRVRSTDPAMISPESEAFSMYYIGFGNPILISRDGDGNIPSGGIIEKCAGETLVLAAHNVPNEETFNYVWYRSGTILSETSSELNVEQNGMYFVEIDYGPNCSGSANTISNTIEIQGGTLPGISISANSSTNLCAGQTVDLVANINDASWTYTWFLNGAAVTTPTLGDNSFTVDSSTASFDGDYTLQVEGDDICAEITNTITINDMGNFSVTLNNDTNIVLLPSQTRTLSVSSTATTPSYQWHMNGSIISGETNATLDITAVGVYFVSVTENGGACAGNAVDSEDITVIMPASFEFVIAFSGAYISCESTSAVLELTIINAVTTDGTTIDVTADLSGDFSYQWIREGTAITGETSSSISLASAAENGDYMLLGTLNSFNSVSNSLNATLASGETVTINSTDVALCDGINDVTLTADIDLSTETFTWFRDGSAFSTTDLALITSETGVYQLEILRAGCPILSNEITIVQFDESIVTVDTEENIILQEGSSQTITATGASTYEWFDETNTQISNTASVSLSEEGTYLLIASIGNCQVTRTFTVSFRDNFAIPNVITANGDGVNDLWVLPNSFSKNPDVTVVIYNEIGEELINETNYQNNWPQSSTAFINQNTVFYYRLLNGDEVLNQGTITVIR